MCLEVVAGFEDPSSHGWDMVWPGLGDRGAVSRDRGKCSSLEQQPWLVSSWPQSLAPGRAAAPHIWRRLGTSSQSTAQVEFPEGINLLEKEPGLDISYNFLTISSSECAAQKKFKQRTTEETHCWPDCQQVPSMSSFSVFLFSVSKC